MSENIDNIETLPNLIQQDQLGRKQKASQSLYTQKQQIQEDSQKQMKWMCNPPTKSWTFQNYLLHIFCCPIIKRTSSTNQMLSCLDPQHL